MPGSSLWLVPPPKSPLSQHLSRLISTQIPSLHSKAHVRDFSPHVTLTADTVVSSTTDDPQRWLDALPLFQTFSDLQVAIMEPQVEDAFFRKLTLRVEKKEELRELAVACRMAGRGKGDEEEQEEVRRWGERDYRPHLSLMYSDLPQDEVLDKVTDVKALIRNVQEEHVDALAAEGAEIWLVPTYRDVEQWQPVARRELKGVKWRWEAA